MFVCWFQNMCFHYCDGLWRQRRDILKECGSLLNCLWRMRVSSDSIAGFTMVGASMGLLAIAASSATLGIGVG